MKPAIIIPALAVLLSACADTPSYSERMFAEQRERIAVARDLSEQALVERFGPDRSKWPQSSCTTHHVSISTSVPLSAGGGTAHSDGDVTIC